MARFANNPRLARIVDFGELKFRGLIRAAELFFRRPYVCSAPSNSPRIGDYDAIPGIWLPA
jgi:hypothetical protein